VAEITWGWPEIAVTLVWKLAPKGVVITKGDLVALPMERVLCEDRGEDDIRFSWITPEAARLMANPIMIPKGMKHGYERKHVGVTELQGRWQKLAVVLMWKLARDGVVLTVGDRAAVPKDRVLLANGRRDDIEYRFIPREEAKRIEKWERDNEGKAILERTDL
jgi:hypothetical protein